MPMTSVINKSMTEGKLPSHFKKHLSNHNIKRDLQITAGIIGQ